MNLLKDVGHAVPGFTIGFLVRQLFKHFRPLASRMTPQIALDVGAAFVNPEDFRPFFHYLHHHKGKPSNCQDTRCRKLKPSLK